MAATGGFTRIIGCRSGSDIQFYYSRERPLLLGLFSDLKYCKEVEYCWKVWELHTRPLLTTLATEGEATFADGFWTSPGRERCLLTTCLTVISSAGGDAEAARLVLVESGIELVGWLGEVAPDPVGSPLEAILSLGIGEGERR